MYCKNCGAEIAEESKYCSNCGKIVSENTLSPRCNKRKKMALTLIITICCIVLLVIAIILSVNLIGKNNLQKKLMGNWYRYGPENDLSYTLELHISKDEITYRMKSGSWLNDTISIREYRVVSSDSIEITYEKSGNKYIIRIVFNDNNTIMTMTPSYTGLDSSESWFKR